MTELSPLEKIFFAALERGSPEERAAYLNEACAGDTELRRRIDKMLTAQSQASSFLEHPAGAADVTIDQPLVERPGTMIGPYKLLQQIGEGGMGTVFMAEQLQPVQRKVALKVIKPGMDSKQVIARFEAERQALAMMDHVNIARVFDGGTIEAEAHGRPSVGLGRPYFVMELVHGVPITKYCDDNHLTPRQRLELFVPVCQAIQHAHQKGIIHRDIKPTNVMITLYDGKPVPKVIDFGVAKATEQKLTERTLFTQYGTMVGTLEYMSPEQAEMSALGVDTRSDIYSLGVLLYELLTGSTPLTHQRIREAAYGEILRMIKEEEPPRPSTRLSDSGEALASISAQRHMEPAKLTKLVRGELDWIVMKCLEKDRNRRYETANSFAADVQRYLNDEAVQACPPSAWYRFRKSARRNKAAYLAASVIALAVVLGAGISAWQAIRATKAEHLAEDRLVTEREARAALDVAREETGRLEKHVNHELSATLVDVARLRERVGRHGLGETEQWAQLRVTMKRAETLAENAVADEALVQRVRVIVADLKQDDADRKMVARLEGIYLNQGSFHSDQLVTISGGSEDEYMAAFKDYGLPVFDLPVDEAARRIAASPISDWLVAALDDCASNDGELCTRLLPIAQRVHNDPWRRQYYEARSRNDRETLLRLAKQPEAMDQPPAALCMLSTRLFDTDRSASVELLRAGQRRHPADLWINHRLAEELQNIEPKSPEEGTRLKEEAVAFSRIALAARPDSPALHNQLAWFLIDSKHLDDAIAVCRRSIALKADNPTAYQYLGIAYRSKGDHNSALVAHRRAQELAPKSATAHTDLADTLAARGNAAEAIASYRTALAMNPKELEAYEGLGNLLERQKDYDEAIAVLRKALEQAPMQFEFNSMLGNVLRKKGNAKGAIAAYRTALEFETKEAPVWLALGEVLYGTSDFAGAVAAFQKAADIQPIGRHFHALGLGRRATGELAEATAAFRSAIRVDQTQPSYYHSFAWANLAAGDRRGYQRACADMLNRWDDTKEPSVAMEILRSCLPMPDGVPDMARLLPLAELAATDKSNLSLLGAALYRAGKYEQAVQKFDDAAKQSALKAWDQLFLAMAHRRLGSADKARESFEKAVALIGTVAPQWPESDQVKELRREAEGILKQK